MTVLQNKAAHQARYDQFATRDDQRKAAFNMVGGGDLEAVGKIEELLVAGHLDTSGGKAFLDIGCGPGALARYLRGDPSLRYMGTDVVPQLLDVAREECQRDDWRFVEVDGFEIPAEDEKFDAIAIISVATNIYPEHSCLLLKDAARALKPGGRILMSYLDIAFPRHQATFRNLMSSYARRIDPLVFLDETFLRFFADEAGLRIEGFVGPEEEQCVAPPGTVLADGREFVGPKSLGQTLCILSKDMAAAGN